MEIRHLRYFCVLAEQLHFTNAARLLNVAQPGLSHQIRQLEDELGTQLVDRSNRRVRLTEAGEVFLLRGADSGADRSDRARNGSRGSSGRCGSIVIGVVSTAVCSILPELLRSFRRESPNIAIDIREMEPGEQVEALRRETIDIGLLFLSIQDPAFDSVVVSRKRLILALPTGHRAVSTGKARLGDLERETFLIPRRQTVPGFHGIGARDTPGGRRGFSAIAAHTIAANRGVPGCRATRRRARAGVFPAAPESTRLRLPRTCGACEVRRSYRIVAAR